MYSPLITILFLLFFIQSYPSTGSGRSDGSLNEINKKPFVLSLSKHTNTIEKKQKITIACSSSPINYSPIDTIIKKPLVMGELSYDADIPLARDEFEYLVDLKTGKSITAEDIKKAVMHLSKKNKFNTVEIVCSRTQQAVNLHFILTSFWTFKKIKIQGVLDGKDESAHLYLIERGERFDQEKHAISLEKIKNYFKNRGYLGVSIKDTLHYDQYTKDVSIVLSITRGSLFKIRTIDVSLQSDALKISDEKELKQLIEDTFSKTVRNKVYTDQKLNGAGKNLRIEFAKIGFFNITIQLKETVDYDQKSVSINLSILLNTKKHCVFFGAHYFSDKELFELILSFGQSATLVPCSVISEEISRMYVKKGFLNVQITVEEEEDTCFFVISEGQRVAVKKIVIKGASEQESAHLIRTFFRSSKSGFFYDEEKVRQACDNIISFYQKNGFWDVQILNQHHEQLSSNECELVFELEKGKQYVFNTVSVPHFPEIELLEHFNKQKYYGKAFDIDLLSLQRKSIADYLHKQGYLYTDIKPKIELTTQRDVYSVSIIWQITLKQDKVTFGKTILAGTPPVSFTSLRALLEYQEGDVFNKEKLEKTLQHLRSLELFEEIHVQPEQLSQQDLNKPVVLRLSEDDRYEMRLRAGVLGISRNLTWRDAATYKVGGSFLCKNPFNGGGLLRFDADATRFERHIVGFYRHPWFFGYPCRTTIKGFSNHYIQPVVIGSKNPLYHATQQGGLLGTHYKYNAFTFGFNAGFQFEKTSLQSDAAAKAINFAPSLVDRHVPYVFLEPTIVLDYLNDKLTTTRGSFTFATLKGMFSGDWKTTFVKLLVEQSFFWTIYAPLVFGTRIRFGHVFNQKFNQIMPPERFFLGGPFSLRGYLPDFAPPLGSFIDCGKRQYVPQGGKTMVNLNLELRFPIYKYLSAAIFQDAGLLVGDDFISNLATSVRNHGVAATGFGLRYNTPIGPLRFDLGIKWKKFKNSDSRVAWYLTLGNMF